MNKKPNPYFKFQQFTVFHDQCAMKVGTDGVLLGAWADIRGAKRILDIGTGTGLISLMLAQRQAEASIDTIDIDEAAVLQSDINIKNSPFERNICVIKSSLQEYKSIEKYDLIVSNPPYFQKSLKSPNQQRTLARHTDSLSVDDLFLHATKLLNDKGRLAIIYPYEYKERLISLACEYNLFITKVVNVFPTTQSKAKRILMEVSKEKFKMEESDLVIEVERHIYSNEFYELVKDFYLCPTFIKK